MLKTKPAKTDHPILPVIANRWSPLAFADQPVAEEQVMSLLEAARWAPSSFNEQPWRYLVGYQGDETHAKLAECLVAGNAWAKEAPVLMLSIAKNFFAYDKKPNRHYLHDVGAASAYLALQATELDLAVHQMAGFSVKKARELFKIAEDHEPAAMIAIGHQGDSKTLPADLQTREQGPRVRKTVAEMTWRVE